jgi:FkbM family methyltransferase
MKEKIRFLLKIMNRWSVIDVVSFYFHFIFSRGKRIKTKDFQNILIRPGSSDLDIFKQVIIGLEYDIKLNFEPKIIVDCGANIGMSTLFFKRKYRNSQIISIEPDKDNYELLQKNITNIEGVYPINKALWNHSNGVKLMLNESQDSHSAIDSSDFDTQTITIEEILDRYSFEKIDILKIDIEGGEFELFKENCAWLEKIKVIVIELHDRIKPGCTRRFFKSIDRFDYKMVIRGELIVIYLNS